MKTAALSPSNNTSITCWMGQSHTPVLPVLYLWQVPDTSKMTQVSQAATWVLLSACEQRAALLGGCHCSARFSLSLATMALIGQSRGLGFETIHCRRKTHVVSVMF